MTKYFKNTSYTKNSLKKEYRKLAQLYHPDTGGKQTDFVAMSKEYEVLSEQLKNNTYTTEPIKTEPVYRKNNQTNTSKTEPKKKRQEPIKRAEPDFVFLRSVFKKVQTFSIKHPLICSNIIHTTLAITLWMLGTILFLGGAYLWAWIMLTYTFVVLISFRHYFLTLLALLFVSYFLPEQNPEVFLTITVIIFTLIIPIVMVRMDNFAPRFYH